MRTLTLKNVPDDVYDALKALALRNRRSLNQEAILRLSDVGTTDEPGAVLERIDRHRNELAARGVWTTPEEVEALIDAERP